MAPGNDHGNGGMAGTEQTGVTATPAAVNGSVCGRAVRWLGAAALLLGAPWSSAEVTMQATVSKVETTLDAGGRARRELTPAQTVVPGEELRYTIVFRNDSETPVDGGRIVITNDIPDGTVYLSGTAGGDSTTVEYSADGQRFGASEPVAGAQGAASPAATRSGGPGADEANPAVRSLRWTYGDELGPGESSEVYFHVRMQ